MALSRQFRALLLLTGLWAIPWTAGGMAIGALRWILSPDLREGSATFAGWLFNHALAYGSLGLISGLYLGLLLIRLSQGAAWARMSRKQVAFWAAVAGVAPALLFGALAMIFGAPSSVFLPLAGLGVVSGVGSSVLASGTHAATARPPLPKPSEEILPR